MRLKVIWLLVAALNLLATGFAAAEPVLSGNPPEGWIVGQEGTIVGRVVDAATGAPVTYADIRILELGRNDFTNAEGSFQFLGIGPRLYTLFVQRIGYATIERRVLVREDEVLQVTIEMTQSALELAGVVVTGTGRARGVGETYQPISVVGEAELRRRLNGTLASTIAHLPGVSEQFNGPGASQPMIRGMAGERILILEDGLRTGDISSSSTDHAIAIDPISVKRIEVVRGPAGLMYGSNALGGVVNVVREEIPRTLPETLTGSLSMQGESVSSGLAGSGSVVIPHGRFAVRGELSVRTADDMRTPATELSSSGVESHSGGLGVSRIGKWGYVGASVRDGDLTYEVPSQFPGVAFPGAHPAGIEIQSRRRTGRFELAHFLGYGPISSISLDANFVSFEQREIEGRVGGKSLVGARFLNRFGSGNLIIRHDHQLDPIFAEGAVGFYLSGRELLTRGEFNGSRDASAVSAAAFAYEEMGIDPFRIQLGGRYDRTMISPHDTTPLPTGNGVVEGVRDRNFGDFSASAAALFEPRRGISFGASFARAFRTPSVEELFANAPHLADFSFEIGSPDLEPETSMGGDIFMRVDRPRLHAEADIFRNQVSNFIHYIPTTEADPLYARFPVFRAQGADVTFEGAEASVQWEALRRWVIDANAAYVRGTRDGDSDPLPSIPPLNGSLGVRYEAEGYFFNAAWDAAAEQNRVPRPFVVGSSFAPIDSERPTAGYNVFGMGGGVSWTLRGALHSVSLQLDNLTDSSYRNHISPLKEVATQPGRNLQLLYRIQF